MRWVGKILSLCLGSVAAGANSTHATARESEAPGEFAILRLHEIRSAYLDSIKACASCDQSDASESIETGWQQVQWQNFPNFPNFPNFGNFQNFPNFPNFPNWFNGWMNY